MLSNSPDTRNTLYVVAVAMAVVSVVLAVGVIFFGWFTEDQVFAVIALALSIYQAFIGALAKANISR